MSGSFVICDSEAEYAENFAELIEQKREVDMQVYVYGRLEDLKKRCSEEKPDILVVEEVFPYEERREMTAGKRIVLIRKEGVKLPEEEYGIYKYQSGGEIFRKIMECCENGERFLKIPGRERRRLIGVYSPVGRIGKTAFAICLGEELAKQRETIYLNLGVYDDLEPYCTRKSEYTLMDLLYYVKQENANLGMKLPAMAGQMEELDYIEPSAVAEDLKAVEESMWTSLLEEIMERSSYRTVILDLSEFVKGFPMLLESCDVIYMPVTEDGKGRVMKFEESMIRISREKILGKIKKIRAEENMRRTVMRLIKEEEACS